MYRIKALFSELHENHLSVMTRIIMRTNNTFVNTRLRFHGIVLHSNIVPKQYRIEAAARHLKWIGTHFARTSALCESNQSLMRYKIGGTKSWRNVGFDRYERKATGQIKRYDVRMWWQIEAVWEWSYVFVDNWMDTECIRSCRLLPTNVCTRVTLWNRNRSWRLNARKKSKQW